MGPKVDSPRISSRIPLQEDTFTQGNRQTPQGNAQEKALSTQLQSFMYGQAVPTLRSPGMNNTNQPRNLDLPTERQVKKGTVGYASDAGMDNSSFVSVHSRGLQGKTPEEEGVEVTLYGKHGANEPEQNVGAKFLMRDGKTTIELERKGPEGTLRARIDAGKVTWEKTTYSNGLTGMATNTPITEAEARTFLGKFQPIAEGSKGEQLLGKFDSPQLQNALRVLTEGRPAQQAAWGARKDVVGSWG